MAKDDAVKNGTPDEAPREPAAEPAANAAANPAIAPDATPEAEPQAEPEVEPAAAAASPTGPRRRPPPTLDLEARDLTPEEKAAEERAAAADEPADIATDPPSSGPDSTDRPDHPPHQTDQPTPRRGLGLVAGLLIALVSGVVGGALALAVAVALFSPAQEIDALTDLEARVVDLRQRTDVLESRPAPEPPPPVDTSAIDNRLESLASSLKTVEDKITTLEAAPAPASTAPSVPPELTARLDAVEALAKQANSAADKPAASPEALAAFGQQLSTLEQRIAALGNAAEIAENSRAVSATAARIAALQALRSALASGRPFAEELAAARKLIGAPADVLAPVEVYAATGLPDGRELVKRLAIQEKAAQTGPAATAEPAAPAPADEGFLERLTRSAGSLVSVNRVNQGTPETPSADYAPLTAALVLGDVEAAQSALAGLPEAERATATPVVAELAARAKGLADIDTLSRQLLAALAGSAP